MGKFLLIAFSFIISSLLSVSCRLIPNLGCEIKMTNDYIESTCGLHNGVRFEELSVDTFYNDKTPKIFRVVLAFEGHLKDSIYNKQIDRIYFKRPTGMYLWKIDTSTKGVYHKWGIHKERIDKHGQLQDSIPSVPKITDGDSIEKLEEETKRQTKKYEATLQKTCPIKFKPDTWYFVNFYAPSYEAYLYVDKNMNYRMDKIDKPTNF